MHPISPPHVFVNNWPPEDLRVLVWAIVAGVAALVAAIVGVVDITITTIAIVKRSKLTAWLTDAVDQGNPGDRRVYRIGCNVSNHGQRGLPSFRTTFYVSAECHINQVLTHHPVVIGGPHQIDGEPWMAAEIVAGPIYTDDDVFLGNLEIVAPPGTCRMRWVIKSDDARVPPKGYSEPVTLTLPVPTFDQPEAISVDESERIASRKPNITAHAYIIDYEEYRRRGYQPPSSASHLIVEVKNVGPGVVTDARIRILDGSMLWANESIGAIGVNDVAIGRYRVETYQNRFIGLPTQILVEYDGDGWSGSVTLGSRGDPPEWRAVASKPATQKG